MSVRESVELKCTAATHQQTRLCSCRHAPTHTHTHTRSAASLALCLRRLLTTPCGWHDPTYCLIAPLAPPQCALLSHCHTAARRFVAETLVRSATCHCTVCTGLTLSSSFVSPPRSPFRLSPSSMGNRGYALTSACPELRSVYDKCEKVHLEAFRRGEASIDSPCRDAFEDYKQCVMEVWDAKTQDYLARQAPARGETPPPPPRSSASPTTTSPPAAAFNPAMPPLSTASSFAKPYPAAALPTAASSDFAEGAESSDQR